MKNTRKLLLSSDENKELYQLDEKESQRLKDVLLGIYIDIYNYCEENCICLMLGGGSVLGSVRHGGFIPWDDDMDLMMNRADYDRFAQNFEKSMGDKYELFVPDGKHRVSHLFMKVSLKGTTLEDIYTAGSSVKTGVAIDIFPIENVPENKIQQKVKGFLSNVFAYTAVSVYMFQNKNPYMESAYKKTWKSKLNYIIRRILGALFSFRRYEKWYMLFDKFVQVKKEGTFCTIPTGRNHYDGELQKKDVFFPPEQAAFENVKACIPRQVDIYLKGLFGDYMQIPPIEKREKHFYTKIEF